MNVHAHFRPLMALAFGSVASIASAYDWQSELSLRDREGLDDPTYNASLTYFFEPLNHGTAAPWGELAFTDRIATIAINFDYSSQSTEIPSPPPPFESPLTGLEVRNKSKALDLSYTHRKASSKHSVSGFASVAEQELAFPRIDRIQWVRPLPGGNPTYAPITEFPAPQVEYQVEESRFFRYGIGYDYYLADAWTVGAELSLAEFEIADLYQLTLGTNRLWNLGLQQWAGLRASVALQEQNTLFGSETEWQLELQGRYYFSERTGIALLINLPEGGDRYALDLQLEHYFTKQAYGRLGYSHIEFDVPSTVQAADTSTSEYSLSFGLRF